MSHRSKAPVIRKVGGALNMGSMYDRSFVKKYSTGKGEFTYPAQSLTNIQLPRHMMVIGATNSKKTDIALRLLFDHVASFTRVYLLARDLGEVLYKSLINEVADWSPPGSKEPLQLVCSDTLKAWPAMWAELEAEMEQNPEQRDLPKLLLIDDMLKVKPPDEIFDAFNRGRKYNLTCCYITSSMRDTDKLLRNNLNYILMCRQNSERDAARLFQAYNVPLSAMKLYRRVMKHKVATDRYMIIDSTPAADADRNLRLRDGYKPVGDAYWDEDDDEKD